MEEKMESEHSYSGDSSSSSESSSGSSDGDDEVLEPVRIMGQSLELPQELCEDYSVFKEFFSMKTWDALEDKHKEELSKYLPQFTENEEEEKEKTIKMLFNHEPFHFTSPLGDFYNNLRQGNYRPDIAKMRKFLMKARAKQQKHKIKSYYAKLLPEVLISRERILAAARAAPPGPIPRLPLLPPKPSSKNNFKPLYLRAKQRYFEELNAIRSEVGGDESEDENYPEGPPEQSTRKRKQAQGQPTDGNVSGTLGGSDQSNLTSLECLKNVLAAHRTRRQYRENHPELNTTGITIDDIKQRVALVNGAKKLMFGGPKSGSPLQKLRRAPKKDSGGKNKGQEKAATKKVKEEPYETVENKPLLPNIKIKSEREESDSESSSFVDPITSPKSSKKVDHVEIKQEVIDKYPSSMSNINYSDTKLESIVKQEPPDTIMSMQNSARGPIHQAVPIKLEDLDGIDMMALPVELADDSGEVIQVETSTETVEESLVDPDESLTETTHANFLSLVRALFPARAAHRASKQQLHARCAAVMRSPIAPLNTWYNLSDDWCGELDSALDFLAGERGQHPDDYVPYLQFLPESQMYQWIGAGRDCDAILGRLCERWLRAASPPPPAREPPPPRHPTTWSVRPATESELMDFRSQERKRFSMAAKPFTYIQYGYRSVVGPVVRGSGGGGAVLVSSRPRHAALPALVRDALARLPNGEGTRHHVLTLLRMSQWVAPCSDQTLLSAVSSVLDRLVSAKRDPVVKYDQRTAVWTYLHRHRSEEDWLKISSGRSRNSKLNSMLLSPLPSTSNPPQPVRPTPIATSKEPQHTPPHAQMELEVGSIEEVVENASDSDVDVDDSGQSSSVPHMSSAQLLMQATQASQGKLVTLPPKPKGKLVATPPPKPKANIIPKAASVKQPAKQQSALMAQSAKQANLLAQAVRQSNVNQAKQTTIIQPPKPPVPQSPKQTNVPLQTPKQANVTQAAKQAVISQVIKPTIVKQATPQAKPPTQTAPATQSPKQVQPQQPKQIIVSQTSTLSGQLSKSLPSVVAPPSKSPLIKQRPLQKGEGSQSQVINTTASQSNLQTTTVVQPTSTATVQVLQNKVNPGTRSLLIRPTAVQTTVTAVATTPATQVTPTTRRGVVRVLSPATPASGKSLISPRALMQQGATAAKKRPTVPNTVSVTTVAQSTGGVTAVVSSVPTAVTSSVTTRTVQLAGGRTVQLAGQPVQLAGGQAVQLAGAHGVQAVQLAGGQAVQLAGGQAVQLGAGHTLQLSALQLQHAVRLPGGQTVQLPSGQTVQLAAPLRVSAASTKSPTPRPHQAAAALKTIPTTQPVQIPVSTVQLAGQTVQIAGQTVQLAGQSVQLTGHTVKLPSGQSVQVASQSVLPSQSVQLPSGQTVQIASGNVQTVQLSGSNVQLSGQSVQMPSGQTVQLGSQTVQLSGQTVQLAGQSVQLPSGQTLQLSSGQTVQLSSGQTLQLASGQTVQLANQTPKSIAQVVRSQSTGDKTSSGQPIVAKLLTNAQGQMLSLEGVGVGGGARTVQVSGAVRARGAVRVLSPATRLARPLLLTSAKPLHNIILQQSDGNTIRVTSSGAVSSSQTLVLSNIGAQTVTTSSTSAPVLKLQQVNPIQQVKLAQGIKIQQAVTSAGATTSSGVRSVLMDGQQLKLVGGRHVLARILRPAHPPQ
ncbi:nuclear factor related to kappa-B-binding protein isoform X1 [Spodoptera litura]|uniref:Nuclear factor related to kappa-B-binding protein isoform X1 n=1 Tax=Spodoptera litura TaxID=69820 RepID=A0A9J7E9G0_SPOLT|nr:nuclear factor related to kappa-B-binding protein isoform X1 [Spodoptera litura]